MHENFPKIGVGTYDISKNDINPTDDIIHEIAIIQKAIQRGITHVDTSPFFREGQMEEVVGKAIQMFKREELFVSSKVTFDLSYDGVMKSFDASIKRMNVDYLDAYYVHMPNSDNRFSIKETAKAFNKLKEQGLIRNSGVCNASVDTLSKYHQEFDGGVFATQAFYNLIQRAPQKLGVLDYCIKENIKFIAYRCVQLPILSMEIKPFDKKGAYPILDEMAEKYNKTNLQINLKWILQQPNVHILTKAVYPIDVNHLDEYFNFEISPEDMQILTDNFPLQLDEGVYLDGTKVPLI